MAHHNSTPATVLDAPTPLPVRVWITTVLEDKGKFLKRRAVRPAFAGDVERDLLGVTVGTSRKGRKVRRAVSA
jgi:hypothetical protein